MGSDSQAMLGSQLTLLIFAVADIAIILFHSITFLVLSAKKAVKFIFCLDHQQQKVRCFLEKKKKKTSNCLDFVMFSFLKEFSKLVRLNYYVEAVL